MMMKSVIAGEYTAPPAHGPMMAEICGMTPDASVLRRKMSARSEEHTSELQSLRHVVCRLLLEKKNRCMVPAVKDNRLQMEPTPDSTTATEEWTLVAKTVRTYDPQQLRRLHQTLDETLTDKQLT